MIALYIYIKQIHIGLAIFSVCFFLFRSLLLIGFGWTKTKLKHLNRLSYVMDTGLILAAIYLLLFLGINPITTFWVLSKILLLVVYIFLGVQVFNTKRILTVRLVCLVLALACFYIIYKSARLHLPFAGVFL